VAAHRRERARPADGDGEQHRGRGLRRRAPGRGGLRGLAVGRGACDATIAVTGRDEPVAAWSKAYEALYPRYRELYGALKPTYDKLGA